MTNQCKYFLESNFVGVNRMFVLVCLNRRDVKRYKVRRHYLPIGTIKNYNVITNEKNFHDQPTDSDVKLYEEIRILTTDQCENYATECLLVYDDIKNYYKFIAVDLSEQEELDTHPKAIQQI